MKYIQNFDVEKFLMNEKEGATIAYNYRLSDKSIKRVQVSLLGGILKLE